MKQFVFCLLLLSISILHSLEFGISSTMYEVLTNEVFKIEVEYPGEDTNLKTVLVSDSVTIHETRKIQGSFHNENNQVGNYVAVEYSVSFPEPGSQVIYANVDGQDTEKLTINVSPAIIKTTYPYYYSRIPKDTIYVGELLGVRNEGVSDAYFRDGSFERPINDFNTIFLRPTSRRRLLWDGSKKLQVKVVSAYAVYSDTPGTYTIPAAELTDEYGKSHQLSGHTVNVIELPVNPQNVFIGQDLELELRYYPDIAMFGDKVHFELVLSGNANFEIMPDFTKLIQLPDGLEIEETDYYYTTQTGDLRAFKRFEVMGSITGLTGLGIPEVTVKIFNTNTGELEDRSFIFPSVEGNTTPLSLGILIIFIVILLIVILLFTLHIVKKIASRRRFKLLNSDIGGIKASDIFAEEYELSRREKEILDILIAGKTTKDIAAELFISPDTAKKHIQNILRKTSTHSRLELLTLFNTFTNKA